MLKNLLLLLLISTGKISILALISTGIAGLNQSPVLADSAIAQNKQGTLYYCTKSSVNAARSCAIDYCQSESGERCLLRTTSSSNSRGYAAVAESNSAIHSATSYSSLERAKQVALDGCARNTPSSDVCRITLTFLDKTNHRPPMPTGCINPATGLPMVFGKCSGVDIQGNPYGVKLH